MVLDGELVDLTEPEVRTAIEAGNRHLLVDHGLEHLDLHEITSSRRVVTQTIAVNLYDEGAATVRFPSRLDGLPALALFEGRAELPETGDPIALTDPAPGPLVLVCSEWSLPMEPTSF